MKKIIFLLTTAVLLTLPLVISVDAAASVPSADGIYEVPIQLWHATKDQESMGNQYVVKTARIEVANGKKTITVASQKDVSDLKFWYYTDGSVEGATAEATKVRNVIIGGATYTAGYSFPLPTDEAYVGVKFKASIMPVKPSARIKLDYAHAKLISPHATAATKTPAATQNQQPAKTEPVSRQIPTNYAAPITEHTTGVTESLLTSSLTAMSAAGEISELPVTESAISESGQAQDVLNNQNPQISTRAWIAIPIIILIVIVSAFAAIAILKKKR